MSEWHLKRARTRLKQARKIIGQIALSGDDFAMRQTD
jgi:hypothetical protein